ncbi:hypothetical protein [Mesomycoplasma lagogenitalium]|uniref:Beta-carotene 15,15'-monooxygenase n=1 Tax=Mesomycoplasma lagogenitalium TaxID=171286 RepID=A0ABY8LTN3_9BACT|nr:hypothetical protein [Mesomycoplasma lagogenitalium]WGI36602.1 hypothetical protein QEG99_04020 [Mesomycoplasma lagogenitalium]
MKFLKTLGFLSLTVTIFLISAIISVIIDFSLNIYSLESYGAIMTILSSVSLTTILILKSIYVFMYIDENIKTKLLYIFFILILLYFIKKDKSINYFDNNKKIERKMIKTIGFISLAEKIVILIAIILFAYSRIIGQYLFNILSKDIGAEMFIFSIFCWIITSVIAIWTFAFKVIYIKMEINESKKNKLFIIFFTLINLYFLNYQIDEQEINDDEKSKKQNLVLQIMGYLSLLLKIIILISTILLILSINDYNFANGKLSDPTFLSVITPCFILIWNFIIKVLFVHYELKICKKKKMLYIFLTLISYYVIKTKNKSLECKIN